ncbi:HD domain-containing protein [Massilia glaciei]|uniref:HD domain-containing protein n=2 Tax=Massilia glaciei TaxID=1524097 RepID=A0A2U2HEI3_9BURK|nr:HD domain-containing phosphohydrolase [Massilia glaciei]PWF41926.1 HD domain-containing protein [Massilia glaciei]
MSPAAGAAHAPTHHQPPAQTLLCVDDEPNILAALRRLFRPLGYQVLCADGGAAGLALMEHAAVDLVISDMRMPDMDGAEFLERARARWPDTVRMLLAGHADVGTILAAINRGEIYRYIPKPWDDNDILLLVRHALERRALEREKRALEQLAHSQNQALKALNTALEEKVAARTRELERSRDTVVAANEKLKNNFITTIKIFSSIIELRGDRPAGHARRVAELARRIAVKMGLAPQQTQEVFIAALLHEIGKIGLPDELLRGPANALGGELLGLFRKHPGRAAQALMPLDELRGVAAILRAQMERFDGAGFPDGLAGQAIPLGARILALASDYDNLQLGALVRRRMAPGDARQLVCDSAGKRYDPAVVAAFCALADAGPAGPVRDVALLSRALAPGMVLSRDLLSGDGVMLLSCEHVLDGALIRQVQEFETKHEQRLQVWVWQPRPA